jgi:preprotein translocase subunit SecD
MRLKTILPILVTLVMLSACSSLRSKSSPKWHLTLEIDPTVSDRGRLVNETISVLERRLDRYGMSDVAIQTVGKPENGQIRVSLPGATDPERVKNFIVSQGLVQLVHVISEHSSAPYREQTTKGLNASSTSNSENLPQNQRLLPFPEETGSTRSVKWVVAEFPPLVDGSEIRNAVAVRETDSNYQVNFNLTAKGAEKFSAWTKLNINQMLGVVLNGEVKSVATIRSPFYDSAQITGRFTKESAEDIAHILNSGPLPAPLKIVKEEMN